MNDNPGQKKPTLWEKVQPWLTFGPITALLTALSVLATNGLQFWMQGLVRDAEVSGARAAATLSMSGACKAPMPVSDVQIEAAVRTAAKQCTDAIAALGDKKPATAQRRATSKPKETGSIW